MPYDLPDKYRDEDLTERRKRSRRPFKIGGRRVTDPWVESARRFIVTEECECDCFLCTKGEHCGRCDTELESDTIEKKSDDAA